VATTEFGGGLVMIASLKLGETSNRVSRRGQGGLF